MDLTSLEFPKPTGNKLYYATFHTGIHQLGASHPCFEFSFGCQEAPSLFRGLTLIAMLAYILCRSSGPSFYMDFDYYNSLSIHISFYYSQPQVYILKVDEPTSK